MKFRYLLAVPGLFSSAAAWSQVVVADATAVATGKDRARVVATITSPVTDELVGCSTPIAAMCDVHTVARRGASAVMVRHPLVLEARAPRRLSLHGNHLMPMGIKAPLPTSFPLTLIFVRTGPVTVLIRRR